MGRVLDEPEELRDLGDRVFVAGRMKGSGPSSGAVFDREWANVFTISAGWVVHERVFLDHHEAIEAVGAPGYGFPPVNTYPHTIDNGAGERLTFLAVREDDRGEYIDVRNSVDPGAGPPMHVHYLQEEGLTVERGKVGYQTQGGVERTAGPGETVTFAPGEAHRFWNAGDDELVCTGFVRPPGNFEYFLTEIYASIRRNGGERPGFFDGTYLGHRYRSEFAMTEVPAPVRRFVFPVVAAAGKALGLHRRFADAPAPVSR